MLAVWTLRECESHKEWIYKSREHRRGKSLGTVAPEVDSILLKEWVVLRALPGDVIVMEGRTWIMYAPIGLEIEFNQDDDPKQAKVNHLKMRFPV